MLFWRKWLPLRWNSIYHPINCHWCIIDINCLTTFTRNLSQQPQPPKYSSDCQKRSVGQRRETPALFFFNSPSSVVIKKKQEGAQRVRMRQIRVPRRERPWEGRCGSIEYSTKNKECGGSGGKHAHTCWCDDAVRGYWSDGRVITSVERSVTPWTPSERSHTQTTGQ